MTPICNECGHGFSNELDWISCDSCENLVHFSPPCVEYHLIERNGTTNTYIMCMLCSGLADE